MTSSTSENRRQFYRIDDEISLEYRLMATSGRGASDYFPLSPADHLRNELVTLSHEPRPQLRSSSERDPAILQYLRSLDQRLDLLTRLVCHEADPLTSTHLRKVSLSEGGIAFDENNRLPAGAKLSLRLGLPTSGAQIVVTGMVRPDPDGDSDSPRTHVAFEELTELDRDILARHILRRQAEVRRQQQLDEPINGERSS